MGTKTVRFSDLTNKIIDDDEVVVRLIVEQHPALTDGPVEIEASKEPYQKLGPPPASLQVTHTVARVSDKAQGPCDMAKTTLFEAQSPAMEMRILRHTTPGAEPSASDEPPLLRPNPSG